MPLKVLGDPCERAAYDRQLADTALRDEVAVSDVLDLSDFLQASCLVLCRRQDVVQCAFLGQLYYCQRCLCFLPLVYVLDGLDAGIGSEEQQTLPSFDKGVDNLVKFCVQDAAGSYVRPCTCGGAYKLADADLDAAGGASIIVGCQNCSLCIEVLYGTAHGNEV